MHLFTLVSPVSPPSLAELKEKVHATEPKRKILHLISSPSHAKLCRNLVLLPTKQEKTLLLAFRRQGQKQHHYPEVSGSGLVPDFPPPHIIHL